MSISKQEKQDIINRARASTKYLDDTLRGMLKCQIVDKDGNIDDDMRKTLEDYVKQNTESFNKLDELERKLNSTETE